MAEARMIEMMVKAYWTRDGIDLTDPNMIEIESECMRAALSVLAPHIKTMLADAFRHGGCEETGDLGPVFTAADSWPEPDEYAERALKHFLSAAGDEDRRA